MPTYKYVIVVLVLLICSFEVYSQKVPRERLLERSALWLPLGVSKGQRGEGLMYTQIQTRSFLFEDNTQNNSPLINSLVLRLGYEKQLNKQWFMGLMGQYIRENAQPNSFYSLRPRAYLAHSNPDKSYVFEKYLALEGIIKSNRSELTPNYFRARMLLFLGKVYKGKNGSSWLPSVSYELFKNITPEIKDVENRFLAATRFKLNVLRQGSKGHQLNVFLMDDAAYYFAEPTFDGDGNELKPYRAVNLHTLVFGVGFCYSLRGHKDIAQFVYGLN
ncbi:MAG: hypothetical protein EAZ57_10040 [Cytophagales bacterium]|nr:MAG: hypothetical protein EAZ67_10430 [Cytophagales bacterium]TAF59781.1 MAG: hypothetical protein EAZ57_10040 [Cytophagales bacterium]